MAERSGGSPRKAAVGASSSGRSTSGGGTPSSINGDGGTTSSSSTPATPTGTASKGGPRFPRARYNLVVVLSLALFLIFRQSRNMISIPLPFASVDDRRATQRTSSTQTQHHAQSLSSQPYTNASSTFHTNEDEKRESQQTQYSHSPETLKNTSSKTKVWEPVAAMPPLPEPFHNGGILFFLHTPKCGGSTIREYLKVHSDEFNLARHNGGWRLMIQKMDDLVEHGTNGQLISFETHDQNVPPYTQLSTKVREWKRKAAENNVPFFVATLLRESVSWQISAFNYYYVAPWKKLANDTVEDFLETLLWNPQCSFLSVGGTFFDNLDRKNPKIPETRTRLNAELQKEHCDHAYRLLMEDMDWIGTTERMQIETLPLFNYLFQHHSNFTGKTVVNKMRKRMTTDRLNNASHVEFVRNTTSWDNEWYWKAQEVYKFDQWGSQIGSEFFI